MNNPSNPRTDLSAELEAAIAIHREGRIGEAETTYRRVLAEQPDHAEALHMLGVVHLQNGRFDDALTHFNKAIALNGEDARYYNNLGNALVGLERREEALGVFLQALGLDPDFLIARCNRATSLFGLRRYSEAAREFARVLDKDPGNRTALTNLGALLMKQNHVAEARDHFRRGVEHYPDDIRLLSNLGMALERLNQLDEADSVARRALAIDPAAIEPRFVVARLDSRAGRLDEARAGLTSLAAETLGADLAIGVSFELGQVLDRLGEADEAFSAFEKANSLQSGAADTQRAGSGQLLARVAANRNAFTSDRIRRPAHIDGAPDRPPPVFFVGFPRSGTTLMEQALAAHPDITTTEERSPLSPLVAGLWNSPDYGTAIARITDDVLNNDRGAFWTEAEKLCGSIEQHWLIDKLPLNIVELGYANLLFPDGRAVVALRDPRDVCLSCFMQRFTLNDAMRSFVDFGETVRTYTAVMDLWLHYRETLTIPWMEYRYEDLVEDFEGTVTTVLRFIGLDWHPAITTYREQAKERVIRTPSYRGVTDQVYRRSAGRWRSYRRSLEPHLDVLLPFVTTFGYPVD